MLEIDLNVLGDIAAFLGMWLVAYVILLLVRFGSDVTWKTELIAGTVSLLLPVVTLTEIFVFVR